MVEENKKVEQGNCVNASQQVDTYRKPMEQEKDQEFSDVLKTKTNEKVGYQVFFSSLFHQWFFFFILISSCSTKKKQIKIFVLFFFFECFQIIIQIFPYFFF